MKAATVLGMEGQVVAWIEACLGDKKEEGLALQKWLCSGLVLCRLADSLSPGCTGDYHEEFKGNEAFAKARYQTNVGMFLKAIKGDKFKVPIHLCFDTVDLVDEDKLDMNKVITCLHELGKRVTNESGEGSINLQRPRGNRGIVKYSYREFYKLVEEHASLENQCKEKDSEIQRSKERLTSLEKENNEKESELQVAKATLASLENGKRENESESKSELQGLKKELQEAKAKIQELTQANQNLRNQPRGGCFSFLHSK